MAMANVPSTNSHKGRELMKIEEESEDGVNKAIKATDGKPTGEGEPGPESGMAPQQEPCKVFSLDEHRSKRKISTATEA
jgi:hypothetical protein